MPSYRELLQQVRDEIAEVDAGSARELIDTRDPLVVDVREQDEWDEGHIPGAIHFEGGRVAWEELPFPQDRPLAIQCSSGNRSMSVSSVLRRRGYRNVIQVEGGITKWKMHGFPVTRENGTAEAS
jgi:rhodanese-related sulfurtransferase